MAVMERRQLWTAVHRYLGLAVLLFLVVATVTGIVLSFARPLDAALNPDLFSSDAAGAVDPIAAVKQLRVLRPDLTITAFPVHVPRGVAVATNVVAQPGAKPLSYNQIFLGSANGHIRGVRNTGPGWDRRHIVEGIFAFHYTLLGGTLGRWVMGVAALGWLIGNLIGVYLTLPATGAFWKQWRRTWQLRRSSSLPRQLLDLHRASGLWLVIGVSVLAFTSVAMNFFGEIFTPIVQTVSPARPSLFDRSASQPPVAVPTLDGPEALAIATAAAPRQGIAWLPAAVSYNADYGVYRVIFTDDGFENYHFLGPVSLYVEGRSGRIVERDDPYSDSGGRKLSRLLYPLHTGQVAGGFGVAIVVLLGLATLEMIGTGVYLWLKRRTGRIKARRARVRA